MALDPTEITTYLLLAKGIAATEIAKAVGDTTIKTLTTETTKALFSTVKSWFSSKPEAKKTIRALEGAANDGETQEAIGYYDEVVQMIKEEMNNSEEFANAIQEIIQSEEGTSQVVKIGQYNEYIVNQDNRGANFNL